MNKFKSGDTVQWVSGGRILITGSVVRYVEDELDIVLVESIKGSKCYVSESELTKIKQYD